MDRRKFLKIKLKSLAEEARIIRHEERKLRCKPSPHYDCTENQSVRNELRNHRLRVVRPEARATHIAYGFLRGRSYRQLERLPKDRKPSFLEGPKWDRVEAMVKKYGKLGDIAKLKEWRKGESH